MLSSLFIGWYQMAKDWVDVPLRITDKVGDFALWVGGRLLILSPLLVADTVEYVSACINSLARKFKESYTKILIVYDALPYGGMEGSKIVEVQAKRAEEIIAPINDVIAAIEGKQLMIIGNMGSGKSTVAQYIAYVIGGRVTVYEPEGTPDDWQGLEVIGKGEDFTAIDTAMEYDLEDLSSQIKLRTEKGDVGLANTDRVLIAEEFPELVNKCSNAEEWIDRHGRRGRKAKRFLILLSQFDRVSAWGLEGKGDLVDNFLKLRLGKVAVEHAKRLKSPELIQWLRAEKGRGLLDDEPVQLPPYREMVAVTKRLPLPALPSAETMLERVVTEDLDSSELALKRAIQLMRERGVGDSAIVKEVLGFKGSSYQQGKAELDKLVSS
jgi:energy-coupling factor transporter ATP-binding protein EcfA2